MLKRPLQEMIYFFIIFVCMSSHVATATPARRALTFPELDTQSENNNLNKGDDIGEHVVEDTIKEVEDLIKANPDLPRLTRGEILDIIENITKEEVEKVKTSGGRDQKAIMYVMPYSADNAQNGDVEALYTKPPVTTIVGQTTETKPPVRRRRPTRKPDQEQAESVTQATRTLSTTTVSQETRVFSQPPTTEKPSSVTYRPIRRRTTTPRVYTTSKYPNHKYPDELTSVNYVPTVESTTATQETSTRLSNGGINIVSPPKFHAKPEKQATKVDKPYKYRSTTSTTPSTTTSTTSLPILVDEIQIPDDLKDVLKNLDLLIEKSPDSAGTFIPLPANHLNKDNIKEILAALNEQQPSTTTTTTTPLPDISNIAENLQPEMKELLISFGLLPDPNKKEEPVPVKETLFEPVAEANAEAYTNFRPLPENEEANPDAEMQEFLAKFGLGNKQVKRSQKSIPMSTQQNNVKSEKLNFEMIPSDLKHVISDIGLTKDTKFEQSAENDTITSSSKEKQYTFKPSDSGEYAATKEDIDRLNKLMDLIKQFDNSTGTLSDDDVKHIDFDGLKDLVQSFNVPLNEQQGPNPLDFDPGLQKNEVKRQSTTENPSLAALEESFGGGAAQTVVETKLPVATEPPRKTGFYYLIDWNTFLDIDNEKGKRVNLRFQPKVGDPKRFLSVTVP